MSAASRMFGPSVQIAEVFGYLGGGFVVAAWSAFMATTAASTDDPGLTLGILGLLAAGVLTAIALRLRMGDARSSRAAGVVLLIALGFVAGAAYSLVSDGGVDWPLAGVMVSAVVVLVVGRLPDDPSGRAHAGRSPRVADRARRVASWSGCRRPSSPRRSTS